MEEIDKDQLWRSALGELEMSISGASFSSWVKPCFLSLITVVDESRIIIELACPTGFHQKTVDERFYGQIKKVLENQTGKTCELALTVKQTVKKDVGFAVLDDGSEKVDLFNRGEVETSSFNEKLIDAGINPRFSFDNFVVGSSNNLAYAAAKGVVDDPGTKHNPLFLWGGVGLGKTHLMQAVGRELLQKGLVVRSVTSEQFTNELITTIRNKQVGEFKKKYRSVDALLVDDIQFFARKESTQEEFFHTFNELYMKSKQIIMTSDRKPQDIEKVEARLISRFLGGLTVDVGLPDFEMRLAILKQKSSELNVDVEEGALDLIAMAVSTNARELQGVLSRLITVAGTETGVLTKNLVEREIGVKAKKIAKKLRPQQVISLVAKEFDFKNKDVVGKSRKAPLVRARHICMYLLREEMGLTLEDVASLMGGRDHTTVMHAVEKIGREFSVNLEVREQVMKAKQEIYK